MTIEHVILVLWTPSKDSVLTLISCLYLIVCLLIILFIVYITKSLDSCGIKILNFAIWVWFALIEVGFCSFISSLSSYSGTHDTIHKFKNYFAIVFSIFSFQQNKQYSNRP